MPDPAPDPTSTPPKPISLIHRKATPAISGPGEESKARKGFFRTIGVWLGLLHDYTAEDINRLRKAGLRRVEAGADEAHAKAYRTLAEAEKIWAEAEKIRAEGEAARIKAEGERAEAIARAVEHLRDTISRVKQQGGNVAFDEQQLLFLLARGREEFPKDDLIGSEQLALLRGKE